jgi:hypothetical protein
MVSPQYEAARVSRHTANEPSLAEIVTRTLENYKTFDRFKNLCLKNTLNFAENLSVPLHSWLCWYGTFMVQTIHCTNIFLSQNISHSII